jgi:hypothetical protein
LSHVKPDTDGSLSADPAGPAITGPASPKPDNSQTNKVTADPDTKIGLLGEMEMTGLKKAMAKKWEKLFFYTFLSASVL